MYSVSQNFLEKIKAVERRVFAKVQIDYTDPFIDQSINVSANENANISYPQQAVDAVTEPIGKIASLDGSWVLGEDWVLAPGENESRTKQMGWWGSKISDSSGYFTQPYPTLTVTFFSRPINQLKVVGDNKRGEYPKDFVIKLYDSIDSVIYTETVTNNNQITWQKNLATPITQVVKMTLEISRWSHGGRQVKILEFFTSIQETYEGDDILLINLLEEKEVSQGSLPVGNISSNEIDIRLNNENRKFDAGNVYSPLFQLLKSNRRIKAWLGVEHDDGSKEWVPLGVFWSGDWNVPESETYAQTTGRDRLELLRKSTYSTSQVQQNKSLYELAEQILQDAGLKKDEYWLDENLRNYVVPYAYFEPQSHREALRKIAEACLGQVYCDRNGIIRVETNEYVADKINQYILPFIIVNDGVLITPDDYYKKNRPVKWGQIANYVEVETQPLRPDTVQEVYRSNEPILIGPGETKSFTIFFNQTPCINVNVALEGTINCQTTSLSIYAWGLDITIKNNGGANENVVIVVNAQPLKVMNKEKAIAKDDTSIMDNSLIRFSFPANPLIQTLDMAQTIANKLLESYKDPRRDIEIEWRGNPALLLGDVAIVTDSEGKGENFIVVKQELEYDGALRARFSGRKV
ncbi:hypothetical protein [Caloramator sp. Dgby_cultured_2]|uniref:hypothetical protein n=1 Tax=Caloramator sp. Dgby_cultured_2 TaxID=3029174 RepID=UPI00237DC918|nr:hypothetical protein [Caloramator sp. Dgby_cultured_2]WDU82262.1 hypothetical protein PWK10_11185 [Caloramator sp. Dgby_cultured_2]